jgi:uncharacterized membrane protein
MGEMVAYLKQHMADNLAIYLFMAYIVGGRPGAILAAMAAGLSVFLIVPAVWFMDTTQIPIFYFLFGTLSRRPLARRLSERFRERTARIRDSGLLRRLQCLGPPGVIAVAMLPFKGCGMMSGVLMSKILRLPPARAAVLLTAGSLAGCLLIAGAGEVLLQLIGLRPD